MQSYGQLMHMTVWAAMVITLREDAVRNRDKLLLTQVREERCVVGMGRRVADLEAQVSAYLKAYRDALEPALKSVPPVAMAGQ